MRFDVLTIFPEIFSVYPHIGVLGKAIEKGIIELKVTNIRDYAEGPHKVTDDRPYGGGTGMVMKPEPICKALDAIEKVGEMRLSVLLSPQGERFHQALAWELSGYDQVILVCGRYEGVDERIKELCIDREISIGDFVLSGGELGALIIIDAVSRLVPGVLGGEGATCDDSFQDGLLEYPQYTRPRVFKGKEVPSILLSGDHEKIRVWRRTQAILRTLKRRPDLLENARLSPEDEKILEKIKSEMSTED